MQANARRCIIPVSYDPLNLENLERKEKKIKKFDIKNEKSFLDEIKSICLNF